MYAIMSAPNGIATTALIEELQQAYRYGLHYPLHDVQKQFRESAAIAQRAIAEQAEDALIVASLLYRPCHMLFTCTYTPKSWNSDSLIESGTYDWLSENFDSVVAETIRLQPHARRYLASVVGRFYAQMDEDGRGEISQSGGIMTHDASVAFARGKYFTQSLRLARWINQVSQARLDCMDSGHFERILEDTLPVISRTIKLI